MQSSDKNVSTTLDLTENSSAQITQIPSQDITANPDQPRKRFTNEELNQLASSIQSTGILQPIIVVKVPDTAPIKYMIVAGERRWRAAQLTGMQRIPCIVRDLSQQEVAVIALIENLQRQELNVLEQASSMHSLKQMYNLTQEQLADKLGLSRSQVANTLRLLGLQKQVKKLVLEDRISPGHARCLVPLKPTQQVMAAARVVMEAMNVRDTEAYVRRILQTGKTYRKVVNRTLPLFKIQKQASVQTGHELSVKQNKEGKGKLVVSYRNEHELKSLLHKLGANVEELPFDNF